MIGEVVVGLAAALRSPLWLIGRRVEGLLDHSAGDIDSAEGRGAELPRQAALATRAAGGALRRLARLPRSPWRSTCLYRSIAECLILRHYGVEAAIRIGVRNESPPDGPIVAHAWVVYPGYIEVEQHIPLGLAAANLGPDFGAD